MKIRVTNYVVVRSPAVFTFCIGSCIEFSGQNIMDVCRLCLNECSDATSIHRLHKGQTIISVIKSVIPEISIENDAFSKLICTECLEIVTSAFDLRLTSIENEKKLKQGCGVRIKTERDPSPSSVYAECGSCFDDHQESNSHEQKLPKSSNRLKRVDTKSHVIITPLRGKNNKIEESSTTQFVDIKVETENEAPGPSPKESREKLKCFLCFFSCRFTKTLDKHIMKHQNGQLKTKIKNKVLPVQTTAQKQKTSKAGKTDKLQCSDCKFQCQFHKTLEKHIESHVQPRPSRAGPKICTFCNTEFPSLTELKLHEYIHCDYVEQYEEPGSKKFVCSLCPAQCDTERSVQIHLLSHAAEFNSEKILFCIKCPRLFHNFESLVSHTSFHNENITHRCLKCFKKFSSNGKKLLKHLRRHSSFECDFCGLNTDNKPRLEEHILAFHLSYKQFLCTGCGESFASKNSLQLHVKHKHDNERNFKCTLCPSRFFRKMDLLNHQGVHTKVASFQCDKCPKKFKAYRNLDRHQTFHNPAKVNEMRSKHICDFPGCGRGFLTNYSKARHAVTHSGAKPWPCTVEGCDRAYTQRGDLNKHLRFHYGENTYSCEFEGCNMRFKLKGDLRHHHDEHYKPILKQSQ